LKKKLYEDDPSWEYFTVLEPKKFVAYNNYYYKRTKCHRLVIGTRKAKVMAGYRLIEKDLRNCKVWLKQVRDLLAEDPKNIGAKKNLKNTEDRDKYNLVKGLFVAALTIYGKCFTNCEGRRVRLQTKDIDEKHQETHDEAMAFRHNFAAHSGAKNLEYSNVVIVLDSKRKRATLPKVVTELIQPDSWGVESIDEFIELVDHVRQFALKKFDTLSDLVEREALEKGPDYWYRKAK